MRQYGLIDKILIILPLLFIFLELTLGISNTLNSGDITLCLFLASWMVLWWIFEILPLGITALIPLFFLPFFQIMPLKSVTPAYSNPVIFLFLGGFIIARALEKTKLDERIALNILARTGKSDFGIIIGFTIATAFLSMWISNTATTVMMVPIALSVVQFLKTNIEVENKSSLDSLAVVLFLSIAYSANIGGITTPVGTPPNVVLLGYLEDLYSHKIDFSAWLLATIPVAVTLLTIMLLLLKKLFPFTVSIPENFHNFLKSKISSLGKINTPQKITITVFAITAFLWVFKNLIHRVIGFDFLNDTSIAILAGVSLFLIPTSLTNKKPVLEQKDISFLPWDIVLLFGGGMALAGALKTVGIIQLTTDFFGALDFSNTYTLILVIAALTLFLTEIMSNVALCVVALPMIMKLGETQGITPSAIAIPAALCASFAFSMPISTPPNAIVFGTNQITVKQMLKAGVLLNFIAIALTMTIGHYLIEYLNL